MISFFAKKKAEASSKNKLLFMSSFDENRFCFQIVKILSYFFLYCKDFFSLSCYSLVFLKVKGALRQGSIPAKPRFRSVPDVTVLNSPNLWVRSLSANVFQGASFAILPCLRSFTGCSNFEKWNSL